MSIQIEIADTNPLVVAEQWRQQYQHTDGSWKLTSYGDSKIVYDGILKATTVAEIDKAIGNKGWTHVTCRTCGSDAGIVINLDGVKVCINCLRGAVVALDAVVMVIAK